MTSILLAVALLIPSQARADFVGPPDLRPKTASSASKPSYQDQLRAEVARRKTTRLRKAQASATRQAAEAAAMRRPAIMPRAGSMSVEDAMAISRAKRRQAESAAAERLGR